MSEGPAWGLMGGVFNPIHLGHLLAAEGAREALALDRVVFVPTGQPPHKPTADLASGADRWRMTCLAIGNHPAFVPDPLELEREGPIYTSETLAVLTRRHPDVRWHLIVGADAAAQLPTWHDAGRVVRDAALVVVTRPGFPAALDGLRAWLGTAAARLHQVEAPGLAVSSSEIRERVAAGRSIRYVVPGGVAAYIADHGLYGGRPAALPDGERHRPAPSGRLPLPDPRDPGGA